ncbi:MAG: tetratricopeptide repeat protein, partial [Chloroflexi bacterium]|nr:tetratricopeptide repeat protein [Chloroflexota bacterium]
RAIEYLEQALVIAREIGDRRNEGTWLGNLGNAYKDQGNTSLARQYLEQALAIFEAIKSPYAEESRKSLTEIDSNDIK